MLASPAAFLRRHPAVKWGVIVLTFLLVVLFALEIVAEIVISKYHCLGERCAVQNDQR